MEFIKLWPVMIWNIGNIMTQPVFWIVLVIIWFQFRRSMKRKSKLFNVPLESSLKPTLIATGFGLVGGILASMLLIVVGISVLEVGVHYLWPLAIVLMLINQRFMCFAYAGGILSVIKYFFGVPQISIPQVMGLVAILHLVEGVLILFTGHLAASPLYLKDDWGNYIGGFNLQNFWPLPIVTLVAMGYSDGVPMAEIMKMPSWWPLIKPEFLTKPDHLVYAMLPIVAGLGYGDLALTTTARGKSKYSAICLGFFSLILLSLAILAAYYPKTAILAALFAPLGHEFIIFLGRQREFKGRAKYHPPKKGVMILDLLDSSPLRKAGLASGDIIMTINKKPVHNCNDLESLAQFTGKYFEIEYLDDRSYTIQRRFVEKSSKADFGLIVVPDSGACPLKH